MKLEKKEINYNNMKISSSILAVVAGINVDSYSGIYTYDNNGKCMLFN